MTAREQEAESGTWGIPTSVRRVISRGILDLRATLEDDFDRQLTAIGVQDDRIAPLPANRQLSPTEAHARDVTAAVINQSTSAGMSFTDARDTYVRECAYTFLNRAVGLRCMEERGLLLIDGQPETVFKVDPVRGASSLYWTVRTESPASHPDELWRETLNRAYTACRSEYECCSIRIPSLSHFSPGSRPFRVL